MSHQDSEKIIPKISRSKVGNHNKFLLGKYQEVTVYNAAPSNSESTLDSDFLELLSAADPALTKAVIESLDDDLQYHIFDQIFQSRGFQEWLDGTGSRILWIQDVSGRGHNIFASKLLEQIQARNEPDDTAPLVAYFFSENVTRVGKTVPDMLKSLIYCLLAQDHSARSKMRLRYGHQLTQVKGTDKEYYILKGMLRDILQHLISQGARIYIVVDGLDHLTLGDSDQDAYETLNFLAKQASNAKLAVSGKCPLSKCRKLALSQDIQEIFLSPAVVAEVWGLSEAIQVTMRCGEKVANVYEFLREKQQHSSDSSSWLKHTTKGSQWLTSRFSESPPGPKVLWHRPNSQHVLRPCVLSLQVRDMVEEEEIAEECCTAFISFFYAQPQAAAPKKVPTRDLEPGFGLWLLFAHLVWQTFRSDEELTLFLLNLPQSLISLLRDVCFILNSQVPEILQQQDKMPPFENDLDYQTLHQSVQWIPHDSWNSCFDESYHEGFAGLIDKVITIGPAKSVLLVVDSFDLVDVETWATCLNILRPALKSKFHCQTRLFLSGIHNPYDENQLRLRTPLLTGEPLTERTEYEECLAALHFGQIHFRRNQVPTALHSTNQWIWNSQAYDQWAKGGGLLWICGKPGSGKSVLAKTIVTKFSQPGSQISGSTSDTATNNWFVCDWFYSRRDDEIGTAHISMLKALIYGILLNGEAAYDFVRQYYRYAFYSASFLQPMTKGSWDLNCLCSMLSALSKCHATPQTIAIIDGIDESQGGSRRKEILQLLCQIGSNVSRRVRIIALSRLEPNIEEAFGQCYRITMQEHNSEDIKALVNSEMKALRHNWLLSTNETYKTACNVKREQMDVHDWASSSPTQITDSQSAAKLGKHEETEVRNIRDYLIDNAYGVILWVHLILEQLRLRLQSENDSKVTLIGLRELVTGLPTELDDLYSYMLKSLGLHNDPAKLAVTRRMFWWIIGSSGWERLELQDFLDAMAIPETDLQSDQSSLQNSSDDPILIRRFSVGNNWTGLRKIIYQHCGAFVDLVEDETANARFGMRAFDQSSKTKPNWTLQLLHQTAKSFLEDRSHSGELCIDPNAARDFVLERSFTYLRLVLPCRRTRYWTPPILDSGPPIVIIPIDDIAEPRQINATQKYAVPSFLDTDKRSSLEESIRKDTLSSKKPSTDIAWSALLDYLESRPLARFALRIISQDKDGRSLLWMNESIVCRKENAVVINTSFPLWWVARSYYTDEQLQESDLLRNFIAYACQRGDVISTQTVLCFMKLFDVDYASWRERSLRTKKQRAWSLVLGIVDGLLRVAKEHPYCCYPFSRSILSLFDRVSGNHVGEASVIAVYESTGQEVEDPIRLELLQIAERKPSRLCLLVAGKETTISYDNHCQYQETVFRNHHDEEFRVPVWKVHRVIDMVLKYMQGAKLVDGTDPVPVNQYALEIILGNHQMYSIWDSVTGRGYWPQKASAFGSIDAFGSIESLEADMLRDFRRLQGIYQNTELSVRKGDLITI